MKAIVFDAPGGPDVLRLGDAPEPVPTEDELLVRVHAAGVNRADLLQRRGGYNPPSGASSILGLEIAGEVVRAVGEWQVGDRVMAVITGGGYAELAAVHHATALRIPDSWDYSQAAAVPEAFMTAYLNLFTLGKLIAGERVLIHAAGSGVGTAAIQLAKLAGAERVYVTAGSAEKLARCRDLGADVGINYKTESFRERIEADGTGVDVVLDFVGSNTWDDNLAVLRANGRLMLIGFLSGSSGQLSIAPIMAKRLTVTGTTLRRTPIAEKIALTEALRAFALSDPSGPRIRPIVDRVYELHDAALAHQYMESNANFGKIILTL